MKLIKRKFKFSNFIGFIGSVLTIINVTIIDLYNRERYPLVATHNFKYTLMFYSTFAFNLFIIVIATILKNKIDNIYRTLSIIMIGVFNIMLSLALGFINKFMFLPIFGIAAFLSLILLWAFIFQSDN